MNANVLIDFDFGEFFPYILIGVFAGIFVIIVLNVIRIILSGRRYYPHQVFLVLLPKEKPDDEKKSDTGQQLKEELAKGETIFAAVGGARAQRGFMAWLMGRSDQFSFEVVSSNNKISFYVVAPQKDARYLEQQIHAHYPDAVIQEVEDYNSFSLSGEIAAAYLRTQKSFVFPIKTYQKMDIDPMNSLINILSKLEKDESIAIQYTVRSAKGSWHAQARRVVSKIHQKNSVKEGLFAASPLGRFMYFFNDFFTKNQKDQKGLEQNSQIAPKKLSAVEEDMTRAIEEKNLKAGLDVNLRIIASAKTKERANIYLENLGSAFSEYNNFSYGNVFSRPDKRKTEKIVKDFIYRHFNNRDRFLLNSEELASMFHFPLKGTETPNILWLTAKIAPAPNNIPNEGITLGDNVYRGVKQEIRMKRADRRRHTYVIGKSGTGKSVLLANMAIQDIQNGEGVCVLDPHGDLINDILDRLPPERSEDVIIFSPGDLDRPLALNLLDYDERYPEQKSFIINEMIGIFDKLYDLKATGGPMFEQYMRNAMLLIMDDPASGSTLMEIPKVLADENFRRLKLSRCKNQTVVDFWRKEAEKAGGEAALANIVPYITSKLTSFISNDMMRPIIGQQKSAFNLRDVMDRQKILLIDLPKGLVGEMNAYLLGMILVGKILMAALSRTDMPSENRKDFYLYIDEFQNFTTNSICQILSEARKYALNLIIAHQYIGQLSKNQNTEIKDAVFGNVGTMITFKIGSEDADFLVKEFSPTFNQYDLINIDKGTAYIKLLVDNSATKPFSLRTNWPLLGLKRPGLADKVRALSRLKYGQDVRLVEAEIRRRSQLTLN
ncbi:MAG: TraM recognition domain-containing protein [Patescibacteria group bacterium]|jgi:type IV secretory pathway TraG/TraD family ATPase VirD4